MKTILLVALMVFISFSRSKNNRSDSRVEIYTLTSFQYRIDSVTHATSVVNPVLSREPLVSDFDISSYSPTTYTFTTRGVISGITNVDPRTALAVCVDGEAIYYAKVHPGFLSSLAFGIPVVDPLQYHDKKMPIGFVRFTGTGLDQFDKRNDSRLLEALAGTGRLK